jgi:uncharacterized protein (DUF2237 family)
MPKLIFFNRSNTKYIILIVILVNAIFLFSGSVNFTNKSSHMTKNVYGSPIASCCTDPVTGFYRDGKCITGPDDHGTHIVCAQMTKEFLDFTKGRGNDLSTPYPAYNFPGLKAGDCWCLCISRWLEAVEAGVAPPINLQATHEKALEYTTIELLELYSLERQN